MGSGSLGLSARVRAEERKLWLGPGSNPAACAVFWAWPGRDALCDSLGTVCARGQCCSLGKTLESLPCLLQRLQEGSGPGILE